jgi:hypothetical protein
VDGWFDIDEVTGALSISAEADVEDAVFANVEVPQVRLRLQVQCGAQRNVGKEAKAESPRLEESVDKNQMLVIVNLLNRNEEAPKFDELEIIVGYPDQEFARQIFPGFISKVQVNDSKCRILTYNL